MTPIQQLAEEFLSQRRIAVAGVSRTADGAARSIYDRLKTSGHEVFALNPQTSEIQGEPCYPNLASVPGGVDAVVTVTTPEATEAIVDECINLGVQWVWMHRSIGNSVSQRAVDSCQEHGIHAIAGGCPLMFQEPVDFGHKCLKWFYQMTGAIPK